MDHDSEPIVNRTVIVTVKFLDELMGNSSQAVLLLGRIVKGEIDYDSGHAHAQFEKLDKQNKDLYGAFVATLSI